MSRTRIAIAAILLIYLLAAAVNLYIPKVAIDHKLPRKTPTYILHEWVRKRRLLSLEEGVRRITSELADFMGLKSKGRIAPGMDADLVLFDPTTVKQLPAEWVNDLPGGKPRLIERSEGVEYTIVGGEVLLAHNEYQGGRPGQVVKSTVV